MPKLPNSICDLRFEEPIRRWDEGLPLGNGKLGCLIWGPAESLRLSLDRGDLWDTTPCPDVLREDFTYKELIRLAREGKTEELNARFDAPYQHPTPTKLPAGKLILNLPKGESMTSTLCLKEAGACVRIPGPLEVTMESFLHAEEMAGFVRVSLSPDQFSFHLENPQFGVIGEEQKAQQASVSLGALTLLKYPLPKLHSEDGLCWFTQQVGEHFCYGVFAASGERDGKTEIVYAIGCTNDGPDWEEKARTRVASLLEKGYEACVKPHREWWKRFWEKSAVSLPEPLFEANWYRINYLFGSCSRQGCPPMPLQGVWTADDGCLPPWKGDYHHDLNTQLCYLHYLKANHLEEGETFLDFLESLIPAAREFAGRFYGTKGLCLPSVMAIDATPLTGWPMYSLSITNHLWLCQMFARHYDYTGDIAYLKQTVYPYLSESAACLLGILDRDKEGKYVLPMSSSPEIHDDTPASWVTPNSNYDLALMRRLFSDLARLAAELGNGEEARWSGILDQFAELAVNSQGVLMISPDESLGESHRHHAQAMAIFPLRLLDPAVKEDRSIIDATVRDLERLGTGLWVGFSFTWMAEFYAVQGNGNGAAHYLRLFFEYLCSQNGFHLNGDYRGYGLTAFHYRPFTLEANMCAADAIQEMLLYSEKGVIELFPALPEEWKDKEISFETLRGEKGLLISAARKNGKLQTLELRPALSGEYRLRGLPEDFQPNCPARTENGIVCLTLKAGELVQWKNNQS